MSEAFLCDGELGERLASGGPGDPGDLAARAIGALLERLPRAEWDELDDVVLALPGDGGADARCEGAIRSVLPPGTVAMAVRRGQGSGLDAVAVAARAIKAGEAELVLAAVVPTRRGAAACALVLASERAAARNALTPLARVVTTAVAAATPGSGGTGTALAVERLLERAGIWPQDVAVYAIDEARAARGEVGADLVLHAARTLERGGGRYAVSATSLGEDRGIAMLLERA